MSTAATVRVGLLGCGTVGGALVELLDEQGDAVAARTGLRLSLTRVAVQDTGRPRSCPINPSVLTSDAHAVATASDVDVVVELIGGVDPAHALVRSALEAGKPVVTANKELLATAGAELFELADKSGVDLLFEAAVAGAIPVVRVLRESLVGERITRLMGIVNGTTNFILTRMSESGSTFGEALAEAQELGYAERDPTADVEGHDAAAKAAIMATVGFGVGVVSGDVHREGISTVTAADISFAHRLGHVVKLLAIAEEVDGEVTVRVHPAMIPREHPLASVRDAYNALFVEGSAAGELMLYGRGAGGRPSASAVLGDLIGAAVNLHRGTCASAAAGMVPARIRPMEDLSSQYYLNLEVADRPGVLAAVAGVFGRHGVSIRSMEQDPEESPDRLPEHARLVFITHRAREGDMQKTIIELDSLDVVHEVGSLIRVVGAE
ncbi:MAG: homoserine dehydrogenase [Acidimicrobiales bacterium]